MKLVLLVAASLLHVSSAYADGAAAQCSPLTSYIPVTYTVTSYVTPTVTVTETASAPPVQAETATVGPTSTSTRTSTSTYYSTITVSASPEVTTSGLFSYIVASGTTSWFGSIAPSSGESLVYVTTTIYVQPSVTSTLDTITVSPPPYVSTTYSVPDADVTSTLTTTRTSTTTLSSVVTQLRSSFTPIGSLGWNSSSTESVGPTGASSISGSGAPITVTGTIYWSTGIQTTFTSFSTLSTIVTQSMQPTFTGTLTETNTISLETVSVTGSFDSSASSTLVAATSDTLTESSTAATPSSQPGSTGVSASGFIPSSLPVLPTYGGYGGLSTSVIVGSTSSAPILASSVTLSSSHGSSGQSGAMSASPVTHSSSSLAESSALPISSGSSPTVSATSLASSGSPSSPASSIASSDTPASSGAVSVTVSSLLASSLTSLTSSPSLSLTLPMSSSIQGGLTSLSIPATLPPGSSSTEVPSTVTSSVTVTASAASTSQTSSSVVASESSSIPTIPVISGPQTYGIPSSMNSVVTSTLLSSLPGRYGAPSSLSGGSSVSTSSVSPSSSPSTVPTLTTSTQSPSASSPATSGSITSESSGSTVSSIVSSTVSSASATPSACGEYGNFTLNFDDLPNFSGSNNTDITQAPPIFNGYHHFAFSDGYVYAPPPNDPFPPRSAPHLAVFLGNASSSGANDTSSALGPTSGYIRPGEFGDGSSAAQSAFWFNVYNAWLGCDNSGPEACTYVLTAYVFDASSQAERPVDTVNATTSPCPGFQNCQLQQVDFPGTFQGLSGVQIQAYKGQDQVMFFMDDVSMGWYNNTCAAGLQRLRSPRGAAVARR